jgi:uncharacterized protein
VGKLYTINEIKDIVADVAKQYGVEKIALFGSYARGEQNETSDIDFVIKKGNIRGYFQFCGFVNTLEERLGTHIDVLTYNTLEKSLIKDAIKDEVVLYEQ